MDTNLLKIYYACGCGQEIVQRPYRNLKWYEPTKFIHGHSKFRQQRICKICGGDYSPTSNHQIYCSLCKAIETRTCICGCDKEYTCMHKSKQRFISGHDGKLHKHSEATKRLISDKKKGIPRPQIVKDKLRAFLLGKTKKERFGEEKAKQIELKRLETRGEYHHSEATKAKLSFSKIGDKNPSWQGGIMNLPYPFEFNHELKERIRARDNYTCQGKDCGVLQADCVNPLGVHHIDYNKNNLHDKNLISLCNSCHGKTQHNREYWKEYFTEVIDNKLKVKI